MVEPGVTDLTLDSAPLLAAEEHEVAIVGRSPWSLAWRRLRRNYFALGSLAVFLLIVICCALATVYASHVAHSGPNAVHAGESVRVSGKLMFFFQAEDGIRDYKVTGVQTCALPI